MLEINQLRKSFGEREVLKGVSFEARPGEIIFVLGTSGTGKSVLLKILVGLLSADSGKVLLDGENILGLSERQFFDVRKKIGMVFQQPALFDALTVKENLTFGLRREYGMSAQEKSTRAEESLQMVGVGGIFEKYPHEISYGTQKRVSLARTLAVRPRILLYDEPTTGLDPISTTAINSLIKDLSVKLKTTSVVVSHDMHCALAIADKIIVLDQGSIVAQGAPKEILQSSHPLVKDFMAEVTGAAP